MYRASLNVFSEIQAPVSNHLLNIASSMSNRHLKLKSPKSPLPPSSFQSSPSCLLAIPQTSQLALPQGICTCPFLCPHVEAFPDHHHNVSPYPISLLLTALKSTCLLTKYKLHDRGDLVFGLQQYPQYIRMFGLEQLLNKLCVLNESINWLIN